MEEENESLQSQLSEYGSEDECEQSDGSVPEPKSEPKPAAKLTGGEAVSLAIPTDSDPPAVRAAVQDALNQWLTNNMTEDFEDYKFTVALAWHNPNNKEG